MLLKRIEKYINLIALKEEFKKMGVNFITAGFVGIFIDHYVGTKPPVWFGLHYLLL